MAKSIANQKIITEAKCKTCSSPFRERIEAKRICDELSYESLRAWCKDEPDLDITYVSLRNHFVKHMNEKREVQVRYYDTKYKEQLAGVPDGTNDVEIKLHNLKNLDNSIIECAVLQGGASLAIQEQMINKIPKFYKIYDTKGDYLKTERMDRAEINSGMVNLFKTTSEELRQAMKIKHEILGIDEQAAKEDKQAQLVDLLVDLAGAQKKGFEDAEEDGSVLQEVDFDDEVIEDLQEVKESFETTDFKKEDL